MGTVPAIRNALMTALQSGKIVRIGLKTLDNIDHDFSQFWTPLSPNQWESFEQAENEFRASLVCQGTKRDRFEFIAKESPTPHRWWDVSKLLWHTFFIGGEFKYVKSDHIYDSSST